MADPKMGPLMQGRDCAHKAIAPGEALPAEWGGGVNKLPWAIPLIAANVATKPELVGHFAEEAPDFDLMVPDQVRVEIFLRHLKGWIADKRAGQRHHAELRAAAAGQRPHGRNAARRATPKASVADNDLAVGRAVEAISHSPFWDDTAFFILEDDAQDGGDHVDAHRSVALVDQQVCAARRRTEAAFVDSRFYTTVAWCGPWRRCWGCRR